MLIHVVRSGETLWQIAQRYNVNMNGIIQGNGLENPNRLVIGQSLVIPVPQTTHIVRSGETLWLISQRYDVPINLIVQANQLTDPNVLNPGMKLLIPPKIHITQPGETLWLIANRYGAAIQAIIRENNIQDPNLIYPGLQLRIPFRKQNIEVNAYSYQADAAGAQTIRELGDSLTYHSPFAYLIRESGDLQPVNDELMIAAARAENVIPMMSVTNFTSTAAGSNLAHTILATPELRDRVINNILQIMEKKGYRGVNIDFENVLPADRENYNQFLQLAVDRLHPRGYFVSTAVAPKVSGTQAGLLYEAHDYEAHGRIADFVVLMTYEWGYRLGPPQAISPINQMRRVVEYARSVIPAEKIFLGFQIYARDWLLPHVQGQEAETFSTQEAVARAVKYGASIQYDTVTQSPFFRYADEQGRGHEVWFEDARSAQAKFDLAKEFNLRGISYWALGYPFPSNWALLNDNFNIRKINQ
ncbi:LysM peptidoglycan-binding domain-containing protein [Cytobacillus sp. NCCP-133]|uniref:LysM peptidoglycan-binding domain-containing protein n=1 Tax=Cytobacillus sp. NCCP-133 TaxID=766848 RepID=UPI00222E937E|nr:LysM peptidoglycan-binding domain-containing protein [Cytobacillus sp. NCCP-133]GLB61485.1 germination protein [Cytobacillus sp. NCCP-133]